MIKKLLLIIIMLSFALTGCMQFISPPVLDANKTNNLNAQSQIEVGIYDSTEETNSQSYTITTETFSQDEINIQYPQIHGLGDDSRENTINNLIKNDLVETQVPKPIEPHSYDTGTDVLVLNLKYEVTMHTAELLSILYTGQSIFYTGRPDVKSSYRIANEVYAITIDLINAEKLKLSDFTVIDDDLVQKIKQSTDVTNVSAKEGFRNEENLIGEIQEQRNEFIIQGLESGDEGHYTFCVTPNSLIVSIGISIASGDYALIEIPYVHTKYK